MRHTRSVPLLGLSVPPLQTRIFQLPQLAYHLWANWVEKTGRQPWRPMWGPLLCGKQEGEGRLRLPEGPRAAVQDRGFSEAPAAGQVSLGVF